MNRQKSIFGLLVMLFFSGCYIPEKRVDFDLAYSETRDQASSQEEIAPGLRVVWMHTYQDRVMATFEFADLKFKPRMTCIATLEKSDGTTYTEEYTLKNRWLRVAFVDDDTHKRWLQDNLLSLEIDGHLFTLYDKECTKRVLRQLYMASENRQL